MLDQEEMPHHNIDLTVGQLLQLELDKRKMSQEEFAQAIKSARQTVSMAINGRQSISKGLSKKLGTFFDHPEYYWYNLDSKRAATTLAKNSALQGWSVMVDSEIEAALASEEFVLTNFDPDRLRQASYDFTCSEEAFDLDTGKAVIMDEDGFTIKGGQSINMSTRETIWLKNVFLGYVGTSAELARFGLIVNTGHQSDPGFDGPLQFSIHNPLSKEITIPKDAAAISITFHRLSQKPTRHFSQKRYSQADTQAAQIEREVKDRVGDLLCPFVADIADISQEADRFVAVIAGLSETLVHEATYEKAIKHLSKYLAGLIYNGWGSEVLSTPPHFEYRQKLEKIILRREQIIALYEALGVDFHDDNNEVVADWLDGPRDALLCSAEGRKPLGSILDGIEVSKMMSALASELQNTR